MGMRGWRGCRSGRVGCCITSRQIDRGRRGGGRHQAGTGGDARAAWPAASGLCSFGVWRLWLALALAAVLALRFGIVITSDALLQGPFCPQPRLPRRARYALRRCSFRGCNFYLLMAWLRPIPSHPPREIWYLGCAVAQGRTRATAPSAASWPLGLCVF
jgi:hypothetical protein